MTIIQDGRGNGYAAQVDDHGRLYVNANMVSHEQHHATFHANLFYIPFSLTLADTNEAPLFFYKNTHSGYDYEVYQIKISSDQNVLIRAKTNATYSSGGTIPTAVNTNRSSQIGITADLYEGGSSDNLVLTTTNEQLFDHEFVGAYRNEHLDFKGGLILPTNSTVHLTAQGSAGGIVRGTMIVARHTEGYKL